MDSGIKAGESVPNAPILLGGLSISRKTQWRPDLSRPSLQRWRACHSSAVISQISAGKRPATKSSSS